MSSIMGCFWLQCISACLSLPLARKTPFPSKNGFNWGTKSRGSSCCPVCILITVFLKVFCCKIFIRYFWTAFWLFIVSFSQNVCCFVHGCCPSVNRFQVENFVGSMTGFKHLIQNLLLLKVLFDQISSVQGLEKEVLVLVTTSLWFLMVSNLWFRGPQDWIFRVYVSIHPLEIVPLFCWHLATKTLSFVWLYPS